MYIEVYRVGRPDSLLCHDRLRALENDPSRSCSDSESFRNNCMLDKTLELRTLHDHDIAMVQRQPQNISTRIMWLLGEYLLIA